MTESMRHSIEVTCQQRNDEGVLAMEFGSMERRHALLLLASTAVLPSRFACAASLPNAGAVKPFAMTEVAPGIYVRHGVHEDATASNDDAIANIGFVIGDDSVAIIDPGGSRTDGERLRASVREVTDKPIRYLILSHMHPDHVFGAAAFDADTPRVVGHHRMSMVLVDRGEFYRAQLAAILGRDEAGDYAGPDLLVQDLSTIDLGNRLLDLRAHGTAHTDNDLSIVDRSTGTLWAADLLFVERIPAIDGSILGWLREMQVLKTIVASRVVPGHGPVSLPWPAAAESQERYLTTLVREIRAIIARGGDIDTAVATVGTSEADRWVLFDDYNGRNVTSSFKELEWE